MIDIITDREKGMVKWFYNGNEKLVKNSDIFYAFEYGNNMVMLKTKDKIEGTRFILYNIEGDVILSYSLNNGKIFIDDNSYIFVDNLVSADYSNVYDKIIVLTGKCVEEYRLLILNLNGDEVASICHPKDYYFYSTKCVGDNILVVCQGISDKTKDKYGRNDWNFRIDLNNYYVEKMSITQ